MLKGPPFARELLGLVDKFKETSFPDLFRGSEILVRSPTSLVTVSSSVNASSTWATTAKSTPTAPIIDQPSLRSGGVLCNREGKRIDQTLPSVPQALIHSIKEQKYCNLFHLRDDCYYRQCAYKHGDKLQDPGLAALRHVARMGPCEIGVFCDDKACFSAHRCPKYPQCKGSKCSFPPQMHHFDTRIVGR